MTLDRDAARALFDNAPAPAASVGGSTPFAATSQTLRLLAET